MHPEGMLFPSTHWKSASDGCAIAGCIPAPLLIENSEKMVLLLFNHISDQD